MPVSTPGPDSRRTAAPAAPATAATARVGRRPSSGRELDRCWIARAMIAASTIAPVSEPMPIAIGPSDRQQREGDGEERRASAGSSRAGPRTGASLAYRKPTATTDSGPATSSAAQIHGMIWPTSRHCSPNTNGTSSGAEAPMATSTTPDGGARDRDAAVEHPRRVLLGGEHVREDRERDAVQRLEHQRGQLEQPLGQRPEAERADAGDRRDAGVEALLAQHAGEAHALEAQAEHDHGLERGRAADTEGSSQCRLAALTPNASTSARTTTAEASAQTVQSANTTSAIAQP